MQTRCFLVCSCWMDKGPGLADHTAALLSQGRRPSCSPLAWQGSQASPLSAPVCDPNSEREGWSHMVAFTHWEARQWLVSQKLLTGLCSSVI